VLKIPCQSDKIISRVDTYTPQTNEMVERVDETIKNAIIKTQKYKNIDDVKKYLNKFLIYYTASIENTAL